jgi:hypothetical protein
MIGITRRFIVAAGLVAGFDNISNARNICIRPSESSDAVRLLYNDDQLEITHEPGNSLVAIISFSGIGMGLGGIQIEEFRKSLTGTSNDIYFIKDKTRHWYNSSFHKICDLLNEDLSCRGIGHAVTLGNSMGGFGAIIFAGQLRGCRSAISFSAQSAVDPAIVLWEQRYKIYTDTVSHWTGLEATKLLYPDINYTLFFGNNDPIDIRHATRMATTEYPNVTIYVFPRAGHNLADYLKQEGVLHQLIETLVREEGHCLNFATLLRNVQYHALKLAADCR